MIAASVLLHQQCGSEQLIKRKIKIESLRGKKRVRVSREKLDKQSKMGESATSCSGL